MQSVDAKEREKKEKKRGRPWDTDEDVCLADGCSWRHSAYCVILRTNPNTLKVLSNRMQGPLSSVRKMELDYLENNVN